MRGLCIVRIGVRPCECVCVGLFSRLGLAVAGLVMILLLLVGSLTSFLVLLFVFFLSTYLDWQMAMAMGG